MIQFLANPQRFMDFSRWFAPLLGVAAAACLLVGLYLGFSVPEDYQMGDTVRLLFLHPQLALAAMAGYACMAGAAFFGVVFRHPLADAAARAAAPIGAGFAFIFLLTGSLWGKPMWGTWWEFDAKLTSALILFLMFLAYMALLAAIDDEAKATRAANILAMVGVINLPIIHFSVYWWNTLHQTASVSLTGESGLAPAYMPPFFLNMIGFMLLFGCLWMVRTRAEVWRRKAQVLALQSAERA